MTPTLSCVTSTLCCPVASFAWLASPYAFCNCFISSAERRFCHRLISERDSRQYSPPLSPLLRSLSLATHTTWFCSNTTWFCSNWNYPWRLAIRMVGSDAFFCWWDGFLGILGRAESWASNYGTSSGTGISDGGGLRISPFSVASFVDLAWCLSSGLVLRWPQMTLPGALLTVAAMNWPASSSKSTAAVMSWLSEFSAGLKCAATLRWIKTSPGSTADIVHGNGGSYGEWRCRGGVGDVFRRREGCVVLGGSWGMRWATVPFLWLFAKKNIISRWVRVKE